MGHRFLLVNVVSVKLNRSLEVPKPNISLSDAYHIAHIATICVLCNALKVNATY